MSLGFPAYKIFVTFFSLFNQNLMDVSILNTQTCLIMIKYVDYDMGIL